MGTLNAKQRKASATVHVDGQAKYPIPDKAHAKAALARIDQAKPPLTEGQKAKVRAKANKMLGSVPMHRMPDGTMMPGKTHPGGKMPKPPAKR